MSYEHCEQFTYKTLLQAFVKVLIDVYILSVSKSLVSDNYLSTYLWLDGL